jgi:hypothetical protein
VENIKQLKFTDHIGYSLDSRNFNDIAIKDLNTEHPVFFLDKTQNLFRVPSFSFHAGQSRTGPLIFHIKQKRRLLSPDSYVLAPIQTYFHHLSQYVRVETPDEVSMQVLSGFFSTCFEFYVHGVGYRWKSTSGSRSMKLVLCSHPERIVAGLKVPLFSFGRHIGKIRILSQYSPLQEVFTATCCLAVKYIQGRRAAAAAAAHHN